MLCVCLSRSLLKIDHIEQIVEKVKQLSNAIREDTGFDGKPPLLFSNALQL